MKLCISMHFEITSSFSHCFRANSLKLNYFNNINFFSRSENFKDHVLFLLATTKYCCNMLDCHFKSPFFHIFPSTPPSMPWSWVACNMLSCYLAPRNSSYTVSTKLMLGKETNRCSNVLASRTLPPWWNW